MNICLIPARSKSKRIKNKNIKLFYGKPFIYYSIKVAKESKLFDKIIVSTDSRSIAKIALKFGAEVPFLRDAKLSGDYITDYEVIKDFILQCKKKFIKLNVLCYLYPVNPLVTINVLKKCRNLLLKEKKIQKVITITKYPYPIQRALRLNKNKKVLMLYNYYKDIRSQDLETFYHDAAQCYWYNFKKIKKFSKSLNTMAVEIERSKVCDVDTIEDLKFLKKIYKK